MKKKKEAAGVLSLNLNINETVPLERHQWDQCSGEVSWRIQIVEIPLSPVSSLIYGNSFTYREIPSGRTKREDRLFYHKSGTDLDFPKCQTIFFFFFQRRWSYEGRAVTMQTQLSLLQQGGAHVSQKCSTGYIFTTNTDSCLTHARTAGEMTQADYNCLNISEKSS